MVGAAVVAVMVALMFLWDYVRVVRSNNHDKNRVELVKIQQSTIDHVKMCTTTSPTKRTTTAATCSNNHEHEHTTNSNDWKIAAEAASLSKSPTYTVIIDLGQ